MLRKGKAKADGASKKGGGLFSALKRNAASQGDSSKAPPSSRATAPGSAPTGSVPPARPKSMFARAPAGDGKRSAMVMPTFDDDAAPPAAAAAAAAPAATQVRHSTGEVGYDSGPEEAINFPDLKDSRFMAQEPEVQEEVDNDGSYNSDDSEIEVPVARFGCGFCPGCKKDPEKDRSARTRSALGNKWHITCFNCPKCRKPVRDKTNLFSYRNFPYHRGCYYDWFGDRCESCGEPVPDKDDPLATDKEKRFELGNKVWHSNHFACCVCMVKLDCNGKYGYAYAALDGDPYCMRCHVSMKKDKCGRCDEPFLDGKFVMALNKRWHLNHFCCHVCDKPFGQTAYRVADGAAYCDLHVPRRKIGPCAVCEKDLFDDNDYFENAWGQTYCTSHNKGLKSCKHCGTAVCGPRAKKEAPLAICDHCAEHAVTNSKDLHETYLKVRAEMIDVGVDVSSAKVSLLLVNSRATFEKVANLYHRDKDSALESKADANGKYEYKIHVLASIPRESVEITLAHEIMHIFCSENQFPRRISPMVLEGMGEYASHWYITHGKGHLKGDEKFRANLIKDNAESVLGGGFVACREAVKLTGSFELVLKHVKKTKWFPNPEKDEG